MTAPRFFHGGAPGLQPGDLIRPAISVGKAHPRSRNQPRYNPRRVYITRLRWYADLLATTTRGDVYEVTPVGRALPDLDAKGSFHCSCAQVVAVVARYPVPVPEEAAAVYSPAAIAALTARKDTRS